MSPFPQFPHQTLSLSHETHAQARSSSGLCSLRPRSSLLASEPLRFYQDRASLEVGLSCSCTHKERRRWLWCCLSMETSGRCLSQRDPVGQTVALEPSLRSPLSSGGRPLVRARFASSSPSSLQPPPSLIGSDRRLSSPRSSFHQASGAPFAHLRRSRAQQRYPIRQLPLLRPSPKLPPPPAH